MAPMARVVPSVIVAVIDRAFSWANQADRPQSTTIHFFEASTLSGIVDLLDKLPDELLTLDQKQYANFLLARAALRHEVEVFSTGTKELRFWPRPGDRDALCFVRHVLACCTDEAPVSGSNELAFIDDEQLRSSLRLDLGSVESALRNGEWKAVTVLGGSLVEALLLWAISCRQDDNPDATQACVDRASRTVTFRTRQDPKDPETWDLIHYIEVARELGAISEGTASQARLAKDFRNLIHPGRERRTGGQCDRATALSAVAAVEHVMRNLAEDQAGEKVT
jgi:hypothetical protein